MNRIEARTAEHPIELHSRRRKRFEWLLKETRERRFVDVLNVEFVDAYIDKFKPSYRVTYWGSNKCRQLGADLAAMSALGYLNRYRIGLSGNWQPGFPTWVWSYELGSNADFMTSPVKEQSND